MKRQLLTLIFISTLITGYTAPQCTPRNLVWLDELNIRKISQQWGEARANRSVDSAPLTLSGKIYEHGVGTHATSEILIDLKGQATRFEATVGVDDESRGKGSLEFHVFVDGKLAVETPVLRGGGDQKFLSADLKGAQRLALVVTDARDGIHHDHADWADARIQLRPNADSLPEIIELPSESAPPIASDHPVFPSIHGPSVVGTTPGRPFLHLIPATGLGPLTYSAEFLPEGLRLNPTTGVISGTVRKAGDHRARLTVSGSAGTASQDLIIRAGWQKLAQTPPMGWNSWNVWGCAIDDGKIRDAADWMVRSGLAAHGYQYINIDDCWQAGRSPDGEIQPNSRFPDMKGLADYVHSKGLKIGIYSSPGLKTCQGYAGSLGHEHQDAKTYAKWGFDYLKHDWCTAINPDLIEPYRVMRNALDQVDRDIVYSLCQYGMGQVWKWGPQVGANLWRTTGDITDTWFSMSGIGFGQSGLEEYASHGRYNDPDMLVVGKVGWGPDLHPTRLTPNEQITHVTLWSMLAAPLLIGADLSQLDDFTLALLTNDEVIGVNQDPLARQAKRISYQDVREIWAKPLADRSWAVALFNRGPETLTIRVNLSDISPEYHRGLRWSVRDLWQRKDEGIFHDLYEVSVPAHGSKLIRVREFPTEPDRLATGRFRPVSDSRRSHHP